VRPLDDVLPVYEFSEHHEVEIRASREQVDRALREVSLSEIPVARALWWLRRLGRGDPGVRRPFLDSALLGAVPLDDVPGECIVIGLTGQFWRIRGGRDPGRPRTADEFLEYDRPDMCKAVLDFRIDELDPGRCRLSTETRVHVADAAARQAFRRYWFVIRPFSGLTRILFLRAVRRQALRA
jgi:hypothetical protein